MIFFDKLVLLSSFFFKYFAVILYISCKKHLFDLACFESIDITLLKNRVNIFWIGRYFSPFNYNFAIKSELLLKHRLLLCWFPFILSDVNTSGRRSSGKYSTPKYMEEISEILTLIIEFLKKYFTDN